MDSKQQAQELYKARREYVMNNSALDDKTKASLMDRYDKEEKLVLAQTDQGKKDVARDAKQAAVEKEEADKAKLEDDSMSADAKAEKDAAIWAEAQAAHQEMTGKDVLEKHRDGYGAEELEPNPDPLVKDLSAETESLAKEADTMGTDQLEHATLEAVSKLNQPIVVPVPMPAQAPMPTPGGMGSRGGASMTPRNPETSIRRLTDAQIGHGFA
jgi:hypothetical protein